MEGEVGVGNVDEGVDGGERKEVFEGDAVVVCTCDEGEVIKRLKRFPGHCQYRSNLEVCCCCEGLAVDGRSSRLPTRL